MVRFRVDDLSWTVQRQPQNKLSFIARLIDAVHLLYAALAYFSEVSFGSHCLGQAWKKESLESGLPSRQPFTPLTLSIQRGCVHPSQPWAETARRAVATAVQNRAGKLQALAARPNGFFEPFGQFGSLIRVGTCKRDTRLTCGQPFKHCDAKYGQRERIHEGVSFMRVARRARRRWRTSKCKRRLQKSSKVSRTWSGTLDHDEEVDRLLLSSLRFWEVERDLIEERLAVIRSGN